MHPRIARQATLLFNGFVVHDHAAGRERAHAYDPGCFGGELTFAPRPGARDGDGWLLAIVTDAVEPRSELQVFELADLREPCARVALPQRVPMGSTRWLPAQRVGERR